VNYTLSFGQITPRIPFLLQGAVISFEIAAIAIVLGCILGSFGAAVLMHGRRPAKLMVRGYVSFFTNVPQLVIIMALFFVLPEAGLLISPFWAATVGLMLAEAAYLCEIIKAGIESTSRSQLEAAEVLGLSRRQTAWYITLPHAVKVLYPTLCNQFILCVLFTSIACVVGVEEITGRALTVNAQTFRSFEVFAVVGAIYAVMTVIVTIVLYLIGRTVFRVKAKIF
jgi:polar amino acid transport system permease protein